MKHVVALAAAILLLFASLGSAYAEQVTDGGGNGYSGGGSSGDVSDMCYAC